MTVKLLVSILRALLSKFVLLTVEARVNTIVRLKKQPNAIRKNILATYKSGSLAF